MEHLRGMMKEEMESLNRIVKKDVAEKCLGKKYFYSQVVFLCFWVENLTLFTSFFFQEMLTRSLSTQIGWQNTTLNYLTTWKMY